MDKEFIEKLKTLPSAFEYKGGKYELTRYGGTSNNSYIKWGCEGKEIYMEYTLNQTGQNSYKGLKDILKIQIWNETGECVGICSGGVKLWMREDLT